MTLAGGDRSMFHRYPPLLTVVVALLLAVFALPSALSLPQANPGQTLEYAPVPGNGNAPAGGNVAGLGLGSSSGPGGGSTGSGAPPAQPSSLLDTGFHPSTKQCVGNPPRQTEDPSSPPCVAYFSGDNGGSTYAGVTGSEVRVVAYFDYTQNEAGTSKGTESSGPPGSCQDMAQPPASGDFVWNRELRVYQTYFNDRYQTYGRFVHFFACYSSGTTPEARRADASNQLRTIHPFAAMHELLFGNTAAYETAMAQQGVLVFEGDGDLFSCCVDAAAFQAYPRLLWSVRGSTEEYARVLASYICTRVVGHPTSFSGNPGQNTTPRRLGLLLDDWPTEPALYHLGLLVKQAVTACGGDIVDQGTTDGDQQNPQNEVAVMASFQRNNVTTIVWPGGSDGHNSADDGSGTYTSQAATKLGYLPEVVIGGSGTSDTTEEANVQDPTFWSHVVMVTQYPRADDLAATPCFEAARETSPQEPEIDIKNFGCVLYDGLRMIFTGVQVAGPRLTPASVDQGFHAIPAVASTDPRVPSCFFDPGDYTCVKDATSEWWDPAGQDPASSYHGCYRLLDGGARHLAGAWPYTDIGVHSSSDPCNHQGVSPT